MPSVLWPHRAAQVKIVRHADIADRATPGQKAGQDFERSKHTETQ